MIDLSLFPGSPPLSYLSQFAKDKLMAQISEILEATLQRMAGNPPLAQTSTMVRVARILLRPAELGRGVSGAHTFRRSGPRTAVPVYIRIGARGLLSLWAPVQI